ncbi:hypothetical protein [Bosea sp. (in: a-proteobacteria)]|uniref:hypothetical protein n=1 Tax=Bosea sp. (in: a-proteobacteria) TaxID=1871050 RepID=UPI003F7104EB
MKRSGWGRGIIAVTCAYALIFNAILLALGAGLVAAPSPFPQHVLCAPGGSSEPSAPAGQGQEQDQSKSCCALGCLANAAGTPPPAASALPRRLGYAAAATFFHPPATVAATGGIAYPLGARAPPVLS